VCYLKTLDAVDVLALVPGADIAAHQVAFVLIDADGSPILLRGSVGACMIAAEEGGLNVVPGH
jgi:hypothetical protein